MRIRKLNSLLSDQSNRLNSLVRHTQLLVQAEQILQNLLSPPLKKHVSIGNISNQTLTLTLDSAAWNTKLKLQLPDIFNKFKNLSGLHELKQTKIKINPTWSHAFNMHAFYTQADDGKAGKPVSHTVSQRSISKSVLTQINQTANHINDEKLKNSLLKLAKTLAIKSG